VLKACSNFVGGWIQGGDNLDRVEHTPQAILLHRSSAGCSRNLFSGFDPIASSQGQLGQIGQFR
jgi:hypothetical protein